MEHFLVERNLPGAENLSDAELDSLSKTFCEGSDKIDKAYTWIQSYITTDKIYCVVSAESELAVREHARAAGVSVNIISKVKTVITR